MNVCMEVRFPEAELRQNWEALPDGQIGKGYYFPGSSTLVQGTRKFSSIPVPALVFFANPQRLGPWIEEPRLVDASSCQRVFIQVRRIRAKTGKGASRGRANRARRYFAWREPLYIYVQR